MDKQVEREFDSSQPAMRSWFQAGFDKITGRHRDRTSPSGLSKPPFKQTLLFEALEQRVLMAADPLTVFVAAHVNGAISTPGTSDQHSITLATDTRVVFDSLTNDNRFNWSLDGPNGRVVSNRVFTASDSVELGTTNPVLDLKAGTYNLTVAGSADATGNYSFQLLDLSKATALKPGATVSNSLTPANESSVYKFDAIAGDHFFLDVTGRSGGDIAWQLFDPTDHPVFAPKAMNSASQDVDLSSLTSSGTYTLLVEGRIDATGSANYAFNLQQVLPATVPVPRRAAAAPAPTITWVGSAGGAWTTASNWSTGVVPAASDNVYISLPAGQAVTISSGTVTVSSLTCDCDLTLSGNATLILNGASQINGNLTLAGGTLGGVGSLTVAGAFNVTGSGSYLSGTGTLTTQGLSTVNMAASVNGWLSIVNGYSWVNQGTLTVGGDDYIFFGYGSGGTNTLTNAAGAKLNLSSSYVAPINNYTGTNTLNNLGTLNQTLAGAHAVGVAFDNTGTVNVKAGTLTIGGGGTDTGLYTVDGGATLNFSGGTRNLSAGSNITGTGTLAVSGATVNANANSLLDIGTTGAALAISGGALTLNSAITLAGLGMTAGTLVLNADSLINGDVNFAGTLGGSGKVTVAGAFNVTGSSSFMSGTGTLTTQGVSTVSMAASVNGWLSIVNGYTWVNQGTLTVGGDDRIFFGYGSGGTNTLTNAAGATLNLSSSYGSPLDFYTGTNTLNNFGTLNQTLAGAHAIGITFNNSGTFDNAGVLLAGTGTVNVKAGTLTIGGGGTDTGLYAVDGGATLNFSGGTRNLNAGSNITGTGTLAV